MFYLFHNSVYNIYYYQLGIIWWVVYVSKMPTTVTVIIASFSENFILQILIVDLFLISPLLNGMLKLLY